ncbi:hypothetical protein [Amycolatopsis suaedae]|uniref:Uncharacterized protein n=1 Tax=Amycolatopsis suaedae TaxID=2510978 RepID=A0A4Q7JEH7_9PSEU|nr:hypothetical protein [Amycolatopsis suaedae]RZQ64824.1 hypothetical protein EWH70_08040 [Amycolatopsis suaedae]
MRALEDVAFGRDLQPTSLFSLLMPIWQVEIKATVTEGRDYGLIDRFVERGIAEGGLHTAKDLARFLALDEPLVDRALRFLEQVGHLTKQHDRFALTELGLRSHRDHVCYVIEREDRRKLYFDAFRSHPLGRAYYDPTVVSLLTVPQVKAATSANGGGRFLMLWSTNGFRRQALAELANHADRDRYNLPARIDRPESLGEQLVYLPIYAIRAVDQRGRTHYLAYSQVADTADMDLSELCQTTPEIFQLLEREDLVARPDLQRDRIAEWLHRNEVDTCRPTQLDQGGWQVVLPAEAFEPAGKIPLNTLGAYAVLHGCVLRVLCEDELSRKRGLLARTNSYLTAYSRVTTDELSRRIGRVARQLGLPTALSAVRAIALEVGDTDLAGRLGERIADPIGP